MVKRNKKIYNQKFLKFLLDVRSRLKLETRQTIMDLKCVM